MAKIVRTATKVSGGVTPEEQKQLAEHAQLWIKRIMRTDPIVPEKITPAIKELYRIAGLKEPRVVVVSSPLVAALVGSIAAGIWYLRSNPKDKQLPPDEATIQEASRQAIKRALKEATDSVADKVANEAIFKATSLTEGQRSAPKKKLGQKEDEIVSFLLSMCSRYYDFWQGGNQWGQYDSYLSAMRDVLGLHLPEHEKFAAWEAAAIEGGPRMMHEEFCIVSDFPEFINVDSENRPHCETGPFCLWRDGWALYYLHGIEVPAWLVKTPARDIDPKKLTEIENVDVRREFIRKVGIERCLDVLQWKVIDTEGDYTLGKIKVGEGIEKVYLKMLNATMKIWHLEAVHPDCTTVQEANNYRAYEDKTKAWQPTNLS